MLNALGTKLIVRQLDQEQRSQGGIVLTNTRDPNPRAEIVSMGLQVKEKMSDLNIGDIIVLEWSQTAQVKHQGQNLHIVDVNSIYAKENQ